MLIAIVSQLLLTNTAHVFLNKFVACFASLDVTVESL